MAAAGHAGAGAETGARATVRRERLAAFTHLSKALTLQDTSAPIEALAEYKRACVHLQAGVDVVVADGAGEGAVLAVQQEMEATLEKTAKIVADLEKTETGVPKRPPPPPSAQGEREGYRFGDLTRAAIAKVNQVSGQVAGRVSDYWASRKSAELERGGTATEDEIVLQQQFRELFQRLPSATPAETAIDGVELVDARLLFRIEEGVQLFRVNTAGKLVRELQAGLPLSALFADGVTLLQCGDWLFPLQRVSPCLRVRSRFYICPANPQPEDDEAAQEHLWVGLMLHASVDDEGVVELEALLQEFCDFRTLGTAEDVRAFDAVEHPGISTGSLSSSSSSSSSWVDKVTAGIDVGTLWIAAGLRKTGQVSADAITSGGRFARSKLKPRQEPAKIGPRVKSTAATARSASAKAVQASSFVLSSVRSATDAAVKRIAPVVRERLGGSRGSGDSKALVVAKCAIENLSVIFDELEDAAMKIAEAVADETTSTVDHKYGEEAAELAEDSMKVLTNSTKTVFTVRKLGIKSLAKATARRTAVGVAMHEPEEPSKTIVYTTITGEKEEEGEEETGVEEIGSVPVPETAAPVSSQVQTALQQPEQPEEEDEFQDASEEIPPPAVPQAASP